MHRLLLGFAVLFVAALTVACSSAAVPDQVALADPADLPAPPVANDAGEQEAGEPEQADAADTIDSDDVAALLTNDELPQWTEGETSTNVVTTTALDENLDPCRLSDQPDDFAAIDTWLAAERTFYDDSRDLTLTHSIGRAPNATQAEAVVDLYARLGQCDPIALFGAPNAVISSELIDIDGADHSSVFSLNWDLESGDPNGAAFVIVAAHRGDRFVSISIVSDALITDLGTAEASDLLSTAVAKAFGDN